MKTQEQYNQEAMELVGKAYIPGEEDQEVIEALYDMEYARHDFGTNRGFCLWCMQLAFLWGRIVGIRQERSRRAKSSI